MSDREPRIQIAFPLHLTTAGTLATVADPATRAEQLIEELLFTSPGERLNRPQLGCAVPEMVFASASPDLQAAAAFRIKTSLQNWLGDLITVRGVAAVAEGDTLLVTVDWSLLVDPQTLRTTWFRL